MKVTIENKKGLNKDVKVFVDKKTMNNYMDEKYEEIKGTVNLKGFRPGKVPREVLKRQFGKAIFGEVLDKVLKETSTKALTENKIKPAGQPKLDLKTYGEDKDLEYILSVTELPKVELKSIENINVGVRTSYNVSFSKIGNKIVGTSKTNLDLMSGDVLILFSDGYPDQFGGPKGKKYSSKRLKQFFSQHQTSSLQEIKLALKSELVDWMRDEPQIDDIAIIGIKIK